MRRSVRSIHGRFCSTNGRTWRSAIRRGTTTSTPSAETLMRARRARSERRIGYSIKAANTLRPGADLLVDARQPLHERRPLVLRARLAVGRLTAAAALVRVVHDLLERAPQSVRVVRRHEPSRRA